MAFSEKRNVNEFLLVKEILIKVLPTVTLNVSFEKITVKIF